MKKVSKSGWLPNFLLAGAFALPLNLSEGWNVLAYKKIPPHRVQFSETGLHVDVKKSAAPVIYKLPKEMKVSELEVTGRIEGVLKLSGRQGEKKQDDFLLRVGLVVRGDKKLNFIQRRLAPRWVLELHQLAPEGGGVDRIEFFNVVSDPALQGRSRRHPLSDLLVENFIWTDADIKDDGAFSFRTAIKKTLDVVAVWISIDGDDTGSEYKVNLTSLVLR